jgi:ATP-independent RNA helicase DbpA
MGALGAEAGLTREEVGKISVNDFSTYVAVKREVAHKALKALNQGRIKGKSVKARFLSDDTER